MSLKRGQAARKTNVNVSFLIIMIFQRFDFIIQGFDGKRSKQKRKVNHSVPPKKNNYTIATFVT